MAKIFIFGDVGTPTGFGRIVNEIGTRLVQRKHQVMGAGMYYDGMHPHTFPMFIAPLSGHDIWTYVFSLIIETQPEVVITCQDFPYHQQFYHLGRLDFSKFRWIFITPIDGVPIHRDWLSLVDVADGAMTISKFGVNAFKNAGYRVELLQPGINRQEFYPLPNRQELRTKAGLTDENFVVGTMCQNQGRKDIPSMLQGFYQFAKDKPEARYVLDMDKISPAGWDILSLVEAMGEKTDKLIFREDLGAKGLTTLNERYNILDVHTVLAHREGYGLPLHEALACKVPSIAMDYCSGTEICGDGKGMLVAPIKQKYPRYGTWGNAVDLDPDIDDFVFQLEDLYFHPAKRLAIAEQGYEWAVEQTWDKATDQVEKVMEAALARPNSDRPRNKILAPFIKPVQPGLNDVGAITQIASEPQKVSTEKEPLGTNGPQSNEVTESIS